MAQPYRSITNISAAIPLTCIKGILKLSSIDSIYDMLSIIAENNFDSYLSSYCKLISISTLLLVFAKVRKTMILPSIKLHNSSPNRLCCRHERYPGLAKSLARRPGATVFSSRATKIYHCPARRATSPQVLKNS